MPKKNKKSLFLKEMLCAITREHLGIGGQELGGVGDKGEVANGGPALQKATGGV